MLSLLSQGPSHGYEVRARFEASAGGAWGPLNIGQVYQVLDRLRRDGLVTASHVPQQGRPDRNVYTLTESGRAELETWMNTALVPQRGYRDEFFLKMVAVSARGEDELLALIGRQRAAVASQIGSLSDAHRASDDPLVRLLITAALQHAAADMRVLDEAEKVAGTLAVRTQAPLARFAVVEPGNAAELPRIPRRSARA